ncbi:Armadillo/beta-catenin-like repeat protein [Necator americanus]|uniref:Armadillo/beta-catenin-like repeat protein n=1 Tax=Necator americanus TaxID=51031 RepID=W2TIG8_NECAM|nr:Armadillo/beta-catenin-like repeat protein [Necator americanus]ETN81613.1 Armadillo/beta-catenin-like repeat protein [Necator americanus]
MDIPRGSREPSEYDPRTMQPPIESSSRASPLSVQTNPTMSANFKVQMWQNRPFDSGVHTMTHSQAPSMMSMTSIHAGSQISTMSSVVDTDAAELTDQQQQKFENISLALCPTHPEYANAEGVIPELINLMKDNDEVVVYRALFIMQNIAKLDADISRTPSARIRGGDAVMAILNVLQVRRNTPNIIRMALGTLFQICIRADGLDDVAKVNAQCNGELIRALIEHARTVPFSCYKYALLTLHSLVSDKVHGPQCAQQARQMDTMQVVSEWLQHEKSEKLLPVIVDLVRILCDKNHEQKAYFLGMNGIPKLLNILKKCLYENCLWRTTRLLTVFSNFNPQMLVQCNAPAVLAPQLAHDSERLVLVSLECLRNISDVPTDANRYDLLRSLLRLFGHRNQKVTRYTLDILANLCANNKVNKEFLISNGIVGYLLRVLNEERTMSKQNQTIIVEEIHECILSILCTLCVGNNMIEDVRIEVFRQPQLFLEKLVHMRPVLLKQTLQLLSKAALRDENLVGFRNCSLDGVCFVQQIVYILRVACNQPPETQMVEGIKVYELINLSLIVLHCLCRDRDLLEMVVYYLLYPENMKVRECDILLPVYALHDTHEESIKKSAISLIEATVHHPKPSLEVSTASTAAPSAMPSPIARSTRMSSESGMWQEPMEGAGEQIPEDFAIADDPFVNVFCPTTVPQSSPPFSPTVNHSDMNDNSLSTYGEEVMQINSPQGTWDSPNSLHYMEHPGYMPTPMGPHHPSHHMSGTGIPSHMNVYPHHQPPPPQQQMPYTNQQWHSQIPHPHSDIGMYSMHNYYPPQNQPYPPNPDYSQRYDQYHHQYGRFH